MREEQATPRRARGYAVIIVAALLFTAASALTFVSFAGQQGTAHVVNYTGILRAGSQKLVKGEMTGHPDDALMARLDSILSELLTGEGPNSLRVLPDPSYQETMAQVKALWDATKEQITRNRMGMGNQLGETSDDLYTVADRAVFQAETYSQAQLDQSVRRFIAVNVLVMIAFAIAIAYFVQTDRAHSNMQQLADISYTDTLTGLPNRISCDLKMQAMAAREPKRPCAVFVFDMNNLVRINDAKGHRAGDQVIADFARILAQEAPADGFVARYGGDEFIACFPEVDEAAAQQFIAGVNEKVVAYNLLRVDSVERISFAVGYAIGRPTNNTNSMEEMIREADGRMYERKRQMKETLI